ncbi:protein of unknown function DUF178 [Thermocrinis albus DSM 14484]|uniref:Chorismate dehydratase n=1 Tax=Thermocrinis albus (strain DSM 14484 / JCM 11386 / HI 11/12) TaxID=638303 RepID=D3SPW2_THEAH|nr:menaquinone biosynthesis protein [Thermocrinis albus]ADC89199.1 protein of unknown function DUF178 [Thermocrinis albus DSM 14484]
MVKVGRVSYLNTLPLFYRFQDERIQLVDGHPSHLVDLLRKNVIQAGIVSSVEYLMRKDLYRVVPGISISSREKVCSVGIFSKRSKDNIRTVFLTPLSLTSRYLSMYVIEVLWNRDVVYVEDPSEADALLLIGDEALMEKKRGLYPYFYDLGEEWFKKHSLPFVFALFLVRKDAPPWLWEVIHHLCQTSLQEFYSRLRDGKIRIDGFEEDEVKSYFTECIGYELGQEEMASLQIFMEFLAGRGILLL